MKIPNKEEISRTIAIFESISQVDYLLEQLGWTKEFRDTLTLKQKVGHLVCHFYIGGILLKDLPEEYQSKC